MSNINRAHSCMHDVLIRNVKSNNYKYKHDIFND